MSWNLTIWRWRSDLDTIAKRRKLKMGAIAAELLNTGCHNAVGECDFSEFLEEINDLFRLDELERPFVLEHYRDYIVFNYSSDVRFTLVPQLGAIAQKHGFNAVEG
ncbi:hypothetical protein CGJ63_23535 [Vibrio parahaemolyticus]|nr:hypothetical protein CGK58_21365 [Vibrio parahaemolyticus]TOD48741.1 hypothetical protein CGJ63_23535 [Vibrio parahaemolyticus]TOD74239.1 hypothetical protein CGJ58_23040 [Vibrio parahaemolyticus]